MNSRQRRYVRRYWKYDSLIGYDTDYQYYLEVRTWCQKQFGKVGYRWGNHMWSAEFCFRREKDYVLFVMRWA
jgi:hypothetical protein